MPTVIPAAPVQAMPVVVAGHTGATGPSGPPGPDVTETIATLEAAVVDLQARVTALETAP